MSGLCRRKSGFRDPRFSRRTLTIGRHADGKNERIGEVSKAPPAAALRKSKLKATVGGRARRDPGSTVADFEFRFRNAPNFETTSSVTRPGCAGITYLYVTPRPERDQFQNDTCPSQT